MTQKELNKLNKKLVKASERGNTEQVRELLDAGADVDIKDNDGWTALMWSAYQGHSDTARLLLDAGADVDIQDNNGWTALIYAAALGYADTVKLLLDAGADIDIQNNSGWTALDILKRKYPDRYQKLFVELPYLLNAREIRRLKKEDVKAAVQTGYEFDI